MYMEGIDDVSKETCICEKETYIYEKRPVKKMHIHARRGDVSKETYIREKIPIPVTLMYKKCQFIAYSIETHPFDIERHTHIL